MTKREAISRVRGQLKETNADSRLTNRLIWSNLSSKCSLIIQREADNLKLSSLQNINQLLRCIKVEEAPLIDDCCGLSGRCTVWRTSKKIPKLYESSNGVIIKRITSIDGSAEFQLSTPASVLRFKNDVNSKYSKIKECFYRNGYLYFVNKVKMVEIEGIYKDDISALNDCNCSSACGCVLFLDTLWMVPEKIKDAVISSVIDDLLKSYEKIPQDQNINKKDE